MVDQQGKLLFFAGMVFYTVSTLLALQLPFFWDTILTSTIANWFYENGIQQGIPPLAWDAGHPTFFQIYLSTCWKIFGRSLVISHLAMLPFLLFGLYAFISLCTAIISHSSGKWIALLLFLLHPYLLTQSILVSYDIIQVGFFLVALSGIVRQRFSWLIIGVTGLSLLSLRGQIMGAGLVVAMFLVTSKRWYQMILPGLICAIPVATWHIFHYTQTGWAISTPSDSWSTQRGIADISTLTSNIIAIARGFLDYGAFAVSLASLFSLYIIAKQKNISVNLKRTLIAILIVASVLILSMLPFSNPIGHRYWMPFHAVMAILAGYGLSQLRYRYLFTVLILAGCIGGHWLLYPFPRSNGWDVTLAHLPYHQSRKLLLEDIHRKEIDISEIASAFPLFCSTQQTDLIPGKRMTDISDRPDGDVRYIAFSPVCNDMHHIDRSILEQQFEQIGTYGSGATVIYLYRQQSAGK